MFLRNAAWQHLNFSGRIQVYRDWIFAAGINWNYQSSKNLSNIDLALSNLESWFQKTAEELNDYLYKNPQKEYEYVTSEQSVAETIMANEYLFTADGQPAFHLEPLAESGDNQQI
ncbi:hypothetical protein [Dyadobacter sp. 3J3]|uniref:hypothetical protein n=1 Tax=Dyadobacter sp. 3J3 TaxID=2606600 RepID=UPI00135C8C49|nr:hypothetical protein [Dyadobacter sp. 3J3]